MKKDKIMTTKDLNIIGLYCTLSILLIGLSTFMIAAVDYGVFDGGIVLEAGISLQLPSIE